jgi:intracellular multiplication protein IcmO
VILDEVGYYMVDGMDLMSAQARSLGFSLVFAGQDLHAMKRFNDKVFGSVQGNTNTKIIMRTEDPETAKLAVEAGGKALRAQLASYEGEVGELSTSYRDKMDAQVQEKDRINPLDLKAQDEGEMHILHKDWLVRAKTFYSAPQESLRKNDLALRPNHFITVVKPDAEEIESHRRIPELFARFLDRDFADRMKADAANAASNLSGNDEASTLARVMREIETSKRRTNNPVEASVAAFAKVLMDSKSMSDAYAKEVHDVIGSRQRALAEFDEDEDEIPMARGRRPERPEPKGFAGLDSFDDGPDAFDDHPAAGGRAAEPTKPPPPARAPLRKNRFRKDVKHGVQVDGNELFDMADRISSNDSVMRTLAALDFDAATEPKSRDDINDAIEEAIGGDAIPDFEERQPVERNAIKKADDATLAMMPDFEDEEDEDIGGGDVTTNFLGALIDDEEDDDGDGL